MKVSNTVQFPLVNDKRIGFLVKLCESQGSHISLTDAQTVFRTMASGRPKLVSLVGKLDFDFNFENTTLDVEIHGLIIRLSRNYTVELKLPETMNALSVTELKKIQAALLVCGDYSGGTGADDLVLKGYDACGVLLQELSVA